MRMHKLPRYNVFFMAKFPDKYFTQYPSYVPINSTTKYGVISIFTYSYGSFLIAFSCNANTRHIKMRDNVSNV